MLLYALILGGFLLLAAGWFMHRYAEEGSATEVTGLPVRLIATVVLLGMVAFSFKSLGPVISLFVVLVAGVLLGVLWIPALVGGALSPLSGSLTGGNEQVELKPFYFRAQGLRKRGEYAAALEAVREELLKFPGDLEGRFFEAEILAENLKDPGAAEAVLRSLDDGSGRPTEEQCLILNKLADLQQKHLNDPDGARATLELLVSNFPDTTAAQLARQRLAHFGVDVSVPASRLVVKQHTERLGLMDDLGASRLPVEDVNRTIQELLTHLEAHPHDWEARERLARLYVDPLGRVELATDQLERLFAEEGAPVRHVVRWHNELAELQLKAPNGRALARSTLERLIARFPGSAHATQAEARIRHLAWDERARAETRKVPMGNHRTEGGAPSGSGS